MNTSQLISTETQQKYMKRFMLQIVISNDAVTNLREKKNKSPFI